MARPPVTPRVAPEFTRRRALLAGGGALGLAAAGGGGFAAGESVAAAPERDEVVAFEARHQAGVATPAQARLVFGAFDLTSDRPGDLRDLLRAWTDAARRMTAGQPVGAVEGPPETPPQDTGEAVGIGPSRLTVTVGLGPGVLERLGLEAKRPSGLRALPALPGDQLDPARTGGDLCVQACADDPQV
ncbi:MAG: deferrochelatase/peroxidase EfeB, partial [Solirubrobacteraceae bacterium]|nr:deferrochelatase/peroxidase EfeB [Solirubrobacteraceae bacterium]